MDEKVRISPFELTILTIFFTTGTTLLVIPAGMAATAKQDAWISAIIGTFLCLGFVFFYIICAKSMGRESYIEYLQKVYGKVIGKLIGLSYVYFAFVTTTTLLFYFGNFTSTQILAETPIEVLNVLMLIPVIYVVMAGLEVLARAGELLFPWFMFLLVSLVILLIPDVKLDHIRPIFEASFKDHLSATINFVATAGFPLVLMLMFYPRNINRPDKSKWGYMLGSFIGCTIVTVIILLCILVLSAPATARQMFPSYVLAKTVSIYDIIERIESVMATMWILSIFFKTSIYFYALVMGVAYILNVRNYRFLVVPLGILTVIFSTVVYPNVQYMSEWDTTYWPPYALIMGVIIPLITLIIDKMKKRIKKGGAQKQGIEDSQ